MASYCLRLLVPPSFRADGDLEYKAMILQGLNLLYFSTCAALTIHGLGNWTLLWCSFFFCTVLYGVCIAWVRFGGTLYAPTILYCIGNNSLCLIYATASGEGYKGATFTATACQPAMLFMFISTRSGAVALVLVYIQNSLYMWYQNTHPEFLSPFNYKFPHFADALVRNNMVLFCGMFACLFERARAQAVGRLERANAQLKRTSTAKDQFLANMSHELRTPLHGIAAMAAELKETLTTPEGSPNNVTDSLGVLSDCTEHLLSLISDILDYERINSGLLELESIEFSAVDEARRATNILSTKASQAGVKLECHLEAMQATHVRVGDPMRFRQVLFNLLSNAIKFTPSLGKVTVAMSTPHPDIVRVEVVDTGIGLSPKEQKLLFQSFSQVDSSVRRKYGGSGLGLVISKKLVEAMGGEIGVSSSVGVGSCFWFTACLPSISSQREARLPRNYSAGLQLVGSESEDGVSPERLELGDIQVLLAEDNLMNQKIACRMLPDCKITVANNGMEAVQAFEKEQFDVVLMDCQMPLMDGFQATKRIRELEAKRGVPCHASSPNLSVRSGVPIIALTASATTEYKVRCREFGMDDFLAKPFKKEALCKMIKGWTRKRS